ncbi:MULTISPECIES: glycosyltransferase family 2 protein [Halomonadaceae]|uniref:Glycosyltransferase n=1 Tax=Billgrantia aerodenitrificans TaxID=2733483 RepID=A0ABS9AVW6_9GAMM|nr:MULTISPECIES: glycosyltransferase [Halomonas]MCE8025891.1 glycosyltransferase [Halomonas aerodenitrificans]
MNILPENCAPVLITTYSRHQHLRQTIEALKRNDLAEMTDLYIASDAAKSPTDKEAVDTVRRYLGSIDGFRSVTLIQRSYNFGHPANQDTAMEQIYREHDRLIYLEDDVLTGRGFLRFMNDGLSLYETDDAIQAICGYLWPLSIPERSEPLLLSAFCAWGFAVWRDKKGFASHTPDLHREFLKDRTLYRRMNHASPHLLPLVRRCANGEIVAGDVEWHLYLLKYKKFALFPPLSLVRNLGFDGSGMHCAFDERLSCQVYLNTRIEMQRLPILEESSEASRALYRYFGGHRRRLRNSILMLISRLLPAAVYRKLYRMASELRVIRRRKRSEQPWRTTS